MSIHELPRLKRRYAMLAFVSALFPVTSAIADVFLVTNAADAGAGSLRAAIDAANADVTPPHTINFDISVGTAPFVINLASALPSIMRQTSINASGEAISGVTPGVRLNGAALGSAAGLTFAASAGGSAVSWLSITGFTGHGIVILSGTTKVTNCYIGVSTDGTTDAGNTQSGIRINGLQATIGGSTALGNLISGNGLNGIQVESDAGSSAIRGNRIGTNAAGTAAIPNDAHGISGGGVAGVVVGGNEPGEGNLISGNGQYGIQLPGTSEFWGVQGNFIGTNAAGTAALPNVSGGMFITGDDHLIGSTDPDGRNVISGNTNQGILLFTGSEDVDIHGNYIGTNAAGTAAIAGQSMGIRVTGTVTGCDIGGNLASFRNVISGNTGTGVSIESDVSSCVIRGNYIGTDATGVSAVPNAGGVDLGGTSNTLGGSAAEERNIISGNTGDGVALKGSGNSIRGNYIGLNAAGTAALANGGNGIRALGAASGAIGGTVAGEGNVISGNTSNGIASDSDTGNIVITGNFVGTNPGGTAALPNLGSGVSLNGTNHTLGGNTAAARNVISGNSDNGVTLSGSGSVVRGNYIGINAAGSAALGNVVSGVRVLVFSNGTIGGGVAGQGNVISGNGVSGITFDAGSSAVVVAGNLIGTNALGTAALANVGSGIGLNGSGHVVGGADAAARNLISGNSQVGVLIQGTGQKVSGNHIGTNLAGAAAIGNGQSGIRALTATNGTIGGTLAGEGNVVSGNGGNGIAFDSDTSGFVVAGNRVGTNAAGTAAIANASFGVDLNGSNNTLGGATAAHRNLISGNAFQGVVFSGTGNAVRGNYIGTNAAGTAAIGNGGYGVRIYEADGGELGGATVAEGNLISGNSRGVSLENGSTAIVVRNNVIGLSADMAVNLADNGSGIQVFTSGNTIGAPGAGNVIAGMSFHGIELTGGASGNVVQGNWIGTNKSLAGGLGNVQFGIWIDDAFDNLIGGMANGEGNFIWHNQFIGAVVERADGNEFSGNSFFNNGLLGLDIGDQGPAANDPGDPDIIGNRRQNYPLLTSVVVGGGSTDIDGVLSNEPDTEYRVEFFSSATCDSTGFGEGRNFRGSATVTTAGNGQGVIDTTLGLAVPDAFMSATVTDEAGNTSEFSPCAQVGGPNPGKIQFYRDVVLAYEGMLPSGKAIITRSHGMAGTVSVTFTSNDDSALAGQDYVDSDQVVTFLAGEVIKVVEIPLVYDPASEPSPETALLALASPTGGATLGTAAAEMLIFDEEKAFPGLIIDDASVTEGDSGQVELNFTVHLSPTDHPVGVAYLTEPGTAIEGDDYAAISGVLNFGISASTQTQVITVDVTGDTEFEDDEHLWMRIFPSPGGGNWIAFDTNGLGLIINDDGVGPQPELIFKDSFEN